MYYVLLFYCVIAYLDNYLGISGCPDAER